MNTISITSKKRIMTISLKLMKSSSGFSIMSSQQIMNYYAFLEILAPNSMPAQDILCSLYT